MKKLIKQHIIILLICIPLCSNGHNFTLMAGVNFASIDYNISNSNDIFDNSHLSANYGFHAGMSHQLILNELFSLETKLLFSKKGYILNSNDSETPNIETIKTKFKYDLYYIDLPLTFRSSYRFRNVELFFETGLFYSFGLFGYFTVEQTFLDITATSKQKIDWGKKGDFQRSDYGLIIGSGISISAFQLGVSYGKGLANISSHNSEEEIFEIKNNVFSISLGYSF